MEFLFDEDVYNRLICEGLIVNSKPILIKEGFITEGTNVIRIRQTEDEDGPLESKLFFSNRVTDFFLEKTVDWDESRALIDQTIKNTIFFERKITFGDVKITFKIFKSIDNISTNIIVAVIDDNESIPNFFGEEITNSRKHSNLSFYLN